MKWRVVIFVIGTGASLLSGLKCSYLRKTWRTEDILFDHSWVLCDLRGSKIEIENFKAGVPYIEMDTTGNILIFTGCDYILGEYTYTDENLINFSFVSNGFCLGPVGNDFIRGLKSANKIEIIKEKLFLMDDSSVVMAFFPSK